jgi:putative membrane protein
MLQLLGQWLVSSSVLVIVAFIVPGIRLSSFGTAMLASLIVGLLNILIRPLLLFLTIPINILTLGFFTFVVNAIILRVAAGLLTGFEISGWISAIIGAIVLSVVNYLFYKVLGPAYLSIGVSI